MHDFREELDISLISNEAVRHEYEVLTRRFASITKSAVSAYPIGGFPVRTSFVKDTQFNASVKLFHGAYQINITGAVPILLMAFFDRLLNDPEVFPWISCEEIGEVNYDIPFSVQADNLENTQQWNISTNKIRSFAAYTLSDMACSFIFLHELGHILCGHLSENEQIVEFNMTDKLTSRDYELSQLKEYEADAVTSSLITHYILELIEDVEKNERTNAVFGPKELAGEKSLSICIIALYGMFSYTKGMARKLNLNSTHPDPLVRAAYIRDMVYHVTSQTVKLDPEILMDGLQSHFEQFNSVLSSINLIDPGSVTPEAMKLVDQETIKLKKLKKKLGHKTEKFSFVEWDK